MLLNWSNSQGLNALMNSAEFIAGFADKGSGEVDLVLSKGTGSATFTRATTATTVNSSGTIVSVASGTPRSYYDPATLAYMGYLAEGARTNLCLQSNAFTTTWTNTAGLAATQNQTGPDGATSAWTMTGTGSNYCEQAMTLTAATYTASIYVKKTTSATNFPVLECFASPLAALCTIDTNNGVATIWTAKTGGWTIVTSSATCKSFGVNYWRVDLTFLATAASWTIRIMPCGATSATQSTGVPLGGIGSNVYYGAQVELGSFASTYIPTTTASVTRNADVLTYPTAGNISGTVGTIYGEMAGVNNVVAQRLLLTVDGSNSTFSRTGGGGNTPYLYDGAFRGPGPTISSPTTANKIAFSWGSSSAIAVNGSVNSALGFDGDLNAGANMYIGGLSSGANSNEGPIRNVRIYQTQLSASQLQAVTA